MVWEKWNRISHVVSALVCLHDSTKLMHLHLTMVHYRACQWTKYLRGTDMLKIKAFSKKKNYIKLKKINPKNASKKNKYCPHQMRIGDANSSPVRYSTGHWATMKAGSASQQQTGPAVGSEWAIYAHLPTSLSHSLEKNDVKSSNRNEYSCRFYFLLQKAQGKVMNFNLQLPK